MSPISDKDLADIEAIAATGRPIPGLIVRSIIRRLRDAEAPTYVPERRRARRLAKPVSA